MAEEVEQLELERDEVQELPMLLRPGSVGDTERQNSYLLYPDRELSRFMDKYNSTIAAAAFSSAAGPGGLW